AIGAPQRPSAAPPSQPASEPAPAPRLRDWIGVLAMVTGLVMAIMDVQIVTSSLTQIQGGLSATADEIAWVQTAYLIATARDGSDAIASINTAIAAPAAAPSNAGRHFQFDQNVATA